MDLFFFILPLVLVAFGYMMPDMAERPRPATLPVRSGSCRRR